MGWGGYKVDARYFAIPSWSPTSWTLPAWDFRFWPWDCRRRLWICLCTVSLVEARFSVIRDSCFADLWWFLPSSFPARRISRADHALSSNSPLSARRSDRVEKIMMIREAIKTGILHTKLDDDWQTLTRLSFSNMRASLVVMDLFRLATSSLNCVRAITWSELSKRMFGVRSSNVVLLMEQFAHEQMKKEEFKKITTRTGQQTLLLYGMDRNKWKNPKIFVFGYFDKKMSWTRDNTSAKEEPFQKKVFKDWTLYRCQINPLPVEVIFRMPHEASISRNWLVMTLFLFVVSFVRRVPSEMNRRWIDVDGNVVCPS